MSRICMHALPRRGALLMVRRPGVTLCPPHAGRHHLAGVVADVAFCGRGYEHAIDLPGQGRLTGVFSAVRAARGAAVGLRLAPGRAAMYSCRPAAGRPARSRASRLAFRKRSPALHPGSCLTH